MVVGLLPQPTKLIFGQRHALQICEENKPLKHGRIRPRTKRWTVLKIGGEAGSQVMMTTKDIFILIMRNLEAKPKPMVLTSKT